MSDNSPDSGNSKRPVRSFVIRSGRLTESQRKAIDSYWDDYVLPFEPALTNWQTVFSSE